MNDILDKIEIGSRYVVKVPAKFQEAFENGEYFMMQNEKNGKMWPNLMKIAENGRKEVVSPLPIEKQDFIQGNPIQGFSSEYLNMMMMQQMAELSALIQDTYNAVKEIEQGQMDDKIGSIEAGKNGIFLALSMPEGPERMMQLDSSRQILLVAQGQIRERLKRKVSKFSPVPKTAFGQFFNELMKSGYLDRKDQEVSDIQEYYNLYLESTKFLAGSYAICGNLETAKNTFEIAEKNLEEIDFDRIKSIGYSHKDLPEMFFDHPIEYVIAERESLLDEAKDYDYLSIEVSGEKLLEELNNGRTEQI